MVEGLLLSFDNFPSFVGVAAKFLSRKCFHLDLKLLCRTYLRNRDMLLIFGIEVNDLNNIEIRVPTCLGIYRHMVTRGKTEVFFSVAGKLIFHQSLFVKKKKSFS